MTSVPLLDPDLLDSLDPDSESSSDSDSLECADSDYSDDYSDSFDPDSDSPIQLNSAYNATARPPLFLRRGLLLVPHQYRNLKSLALVVLFLTQLGPKKLSLTSLMNVLWIVSVLKRYYGLDLLKTLRLGDDDETTISIQPKKYNHEQRFTFADLRRETVRDVCSFSCTVNDEQKTRVPRSPPLPIPPSPPHRLILPTNDLSIVVNLPLDSAVSTLPDLKESIDTLLALHRSRNGNETEIILSLTSPGGEISAYGAASSQISRLRAEPNITTTIVVDRVAASGGYLLAVLASPSRLFSAPFALTGSIGVVGEQLNFYRFLTEKGVDSVTLTAGVDKAPLTPLSEITEEGKEKTSEMLTDVHAVFKSHVLTNRPAVDLDVVATGKVYLGQEAKRLNLVDEVISTDEYIDLLLMSNKTCLRLERVKAPQPFESFLNPIEASLQKFKV
eukprot:CAMPEP_0118633446 /NCGR_PEP_ID=MMETSP0785-20121206/1002_1 /TAXON_ID=91992 /ORGANISM="Bolidomonas pacifica, Strain CCMP 1866" /LENGTH=444 /DNA_ID=CAMNT_0006524323 /DNA_START=237 /DNA_END=1566 /DNA_ORIENTATION=+